MTALAAGATYFLSIGMIVPVLPLYVIDKGGNELLVALVVGAPAVTGLLTRPLAGRLASRQGNRRLMVAGAIGAGLSILLYPISDSVAELLSLRLLTGAGEGVFFTGVTTLVADVAPDHRRGAAFSLLSVSVFLGTGAGPLIAVPISGAAGLTAAMVTAGAVGVGAAVVSVMTGRAGAARFLGRPDTGLLRARFFDRRAFGPGWVMALCDMGAVGFFAFVPLYAGTVGAPVQAVFAVYAAVILTVRLVGSSLPDRVGALRCGVAAAVLDAAGLTALAMVDTPAGLALGTVLFALGISLLYPALLSLTLDRGAPHDRPALVGTFTMSFDIAQILGAVVLGLVATAWGLQASFAISAGFAGLGFLVLVLSQRTRTRSR